MSENNNQNENKNNEADNQKEAEQNGEARNIQHDCCDVEYNGKEPESKKAIRLPLAAVALVVCAAILLAVMVTAFIAFGSLNSQRAEFESMYSSQRSDYESQIAEYNKLLGLGVPETDSEGNYISIPEKLSSSLEKFARIFNDYYYYADDIDSDELVDLMRYFYVYAAGDKYGCYYTEEEYASMIADNAGDMVGIGVYVAYDVGDEGIEIINVTKSSPAERAGLQAGDMIVSVTSNGKTYTLAEDGYSAVLDGVIGDEGTKVIINYYRDNPDSIQSAEMTREHVSAQTVLYKVCDTDSTVGIVKISGFELTTPGQLCEALDDLISKGINNIVFDVRNNPGGDLASIRAVMSYFLNENDTILYTIDKNGNSTEIKATPIIYPGNYSLCNVAASDIGKYRSLNMTVLANEGTTSAAELFTANFKDHNLGTVIGTKTYGKGCMQNFFSLKAYGIDGGLRVTTKLYNPPSNVSYDGIGIFPDTIVELTEEAANTNMYKMFMHFNDIDNQLQQAIKELHKTES